MIFNNQFLLLELSAQEQAIEMYNMLQESLFIRKNAEILDRQITSLHEIMLAKENIRLNWIMLVLTLNPIVIPIVWELLSFIMIENKIINGNETLVKDLLSLITITNPQTTAIVLTLLIILIAVLIIKPYYHRD